MKKQALTLAELTIVLLVMPILVVMGLQVLKPREIKEDAFKKASMVMYNQIALVTVQVMSKYSPKRNLETLYNTSLSSTYLITADGADENLLSLYKKNMKRSRKNVTISYDDYLSGFKLKNGAYFTLKLYGDCATTTRTYNPMYGTDIMDEYDTCGALMYDLNADEEPNVLGFDRYILAIDQKGLR